MGYALYVSLQREIPDVKGSEMSGKVLADNIEKLDDAARQLRVKPLSDMISASPEQVADLLGEETDMPAPPAAEDFAEMLGAERASEVAAGLEKDFAELQDALDEIKAARVTERWFPAHQGLKSVRRLMAFVREHPEQFSRPADLLQDFTHLEELLRLAQKHKTRFHLTPDF